MKSNTLRPDTFTLNFNVTLSGTEEILMAGALRRFNRPCSEAGAPSRVAFLSVHQYDQAQFPQTGAVSPCKVRRPQQPRQPRYMQLQLHLELNSTTFSILLVVAEI